ncbi:MAG: riboflavin synthase [Planctomycetota bacterium]|nr:riboflavin synthase [Planctomycetota bacterium]MCX8040437.1 riboflavin synthase [Planctomycetota bacterium]MDW8373185.1 riboflavin synthase [Planctomycetota bacterium]
MFTGIIEAVGTLVAVDHRDGASILHLDLGSIAEGCRIGDSICVQGVCLTVEALHGAQARFTCSLETRRRTTVGSWRAGQRLNLERALRLGDRLGGHLVGGHVDGVGRILERRREGDSERFVLLLPADGRVRVVEKGSLAVDGVSLTTFDCRGARCAIAVIPHTLAHTTLGERRPGDRVNLETDPIGRWVEALLRQQPAYAAGGEEVARG